MKEEGRGKRTKATSEVFFAFMKSLREHCLYSSSSPPPFVSPFSPSYPVFLRVHRRGNECGHVHIKVSGKHAAMRLHEAAEIDLDTKQEENRREGGRWGR